MRKKHDLDEYSCMRDHFLELLEIINKIIVKDIDV